MTYTYTVYIHVCVFRSRTLVSIIEVWTKQERKLHNTPTIQKNVWFHFEVFKSNYVSVSTLDDVSVTQSQCLRIGTVSLILRDTRNWWCHSIRERGKKKKIQRCVQRRVLGREMFSSAGITASHWTACWSLNGSMTMSITANYPCLIASFEPTTHGKDFPPVRSEWGCLGRGTKLWRCCGQ